jgi:hypothetical protein
MPEQESTAPDPVELTRHMFDAPPEPASASAAVEAFTRFFAPSVDWESVGLGTIFEGLAAARGFVADWLGRFDQYDVDVEEILDLGHGVVLARTGQAGRPVGSSALMPREVMVYVFVWEQGTITRVVSSGDTAAARAAAERLARERGR